MCTTQDSERVTTVQINAKSFKENHWLGHSLDVILIRDNIAGTPLPTKTRAFFVDWR